MGFFFGVRKLIHNQYHSTTFTPHSNTTQKLHFLFIEQKLTVDSQRRIINNKFTWKVFIYSVIRTNQFNVSVEKNFVYSVSLECHLKVSFLAISYIPSKNFRTVKVLYSLNNCRWIYDDRPLHGSCSIFPGFCEVLASLSNSL